MTFEVIHGHMRDVLREMLPGSVDAVVCDPPYELGFMGKAWDRSRIAFDAEAWAECLRVLKPGGHLVAFGGTRTFHRMTCAIEDGGFEIRDCLSWLYGSGFPKSLDVSKAIDKAAGAERRVVSERLEHDITRPAGGGDERLMTSGGGREQRVVRQTAPATSDAVRWDGWGTALKPAWEPIILARKPLAGTVAGNVIEHGVGALNIDGCRIGDGGQMSWNGAVRTGFSNNAIGQYPGKGDEKSAASAVGRWPANVLLDEVAAAALDGQTGELSSGFMRAGTQREGAGYGGALGATVTNDTHGDRGGASRFFYTAKASASERQGASGSRNPHPTVKPLALMRWLCRLVTPPGGRVLDPFCGSGTTGQAALLEGFTVVLVEQDKEMADFARLRIAGPLFTQDAAEGGA